MITKIEGQAMDDGTFVPERTYHRTESGRYAWTHPVEEPCRPDPNHCPVPKEEKK